MIARDCVLIGNGSLLAQCGEMLLKRDYRLRAVVTRSPGLRDWAQQRGLSVDAFSKGLANRLGPFDWLFSIANLAIIPDDLLACARLGAVNFHDGPLPRHAGVNAPVWAILEGETRHGVSWHIIEGGLDEGDLLAQRFFDISAQDTALSVNLKAWKAAMQTFPTVINQIETGLVRVPQDLSRRSYHALTDRPPGFGLLDFTRPAILVQRFVRALDHGPYWNPLCLPKVPVGGGMAIVASAQACVAEAMPGTVLGVDGELTVACSTGALALRLRRLNGTPLNAAGVVSVGQVLSPGDFNAVDRAVRPAISGEAAARRAFADYAPAKLPDSKNGAGEVVTLKLPVTRGAVARWVRQVTGLARVDMAWSGPELRGAEETGMVFDWALCRASGAGLGKALPFATDLFARAPELDWPRQPEIGLSEDGHVPGTVITAQLSGAVSYDCERLSPRIAETLANHLAACRRTPDLPHSGTVA